MIAQALHTIQASLPPQVQLVAVSKFHPVERLMEAYEAGQRVFAESRPQELAAKVPQLPSDIQWHFMSVDSLHLLQAISAWGTANNKVVDVLLELHLGAEQTKQGFSEEEILALLIGAGTPSETHGHPRPCKREGPAAEGCGRGLSEAKEVSEGVPAPMAGIRIRGLMGMATNTDDMAVVEKDFERIEALFKKIKASGREGFDVLSIGMSQDWPVAVRHGATMVRIGTDIFGPREY